MMLRTSAALPEGGKEALGGGGVGGSEGTTLLTKAKKGIGASRRRSMGGVGGAPTCHGGEEGLKLPPTTTPP
ncbi:hypothetical protein E2562_022387 [Oryza meyeriana var. granulata]|uniref:Uncharacterized protein n=1 Tax=Oryza meyeriana var. granulata TaxID=110450 RepID=A0A6G1EY52_9ORYZ|nr:hypothetical protein E2562_022387 [Oryza meyeriana var. granulata]